MAQVRDTWELDHPVEDVWKLFTDPDRWMRWNRGVSDMRDVRGPFDHVGAGYTQVWRIAGIERQGAWRVTGCEPRRWRTIEAGTPVGWTLRVRDEFEPTDAGCRVTLEMVLDAPAGRRGRLLHGLIAERLLRRALRGSHQQLLAVLRNDP